MVSYPIKNLDLSTIVDHDKDSQYDLYATLVNELQYFLIQKQNHFGSLRRGHYVAQAKNKVDQQWYCFDDSRYFLKRSEIIFNRVNPIGNQEEDLLTPHAYILFYIRKDDKPLDFSHIQQKQKKDSCTLL